VILDLLPQGDAYSKMTMPAADGHAATSGPKAISDATRKPRPMLSDVTQAGRQARVRHWHHGGALAPSWSIRGRAAELVVLRDALDRVESGRLAMVLLEGEAGIGKTRLLDHALQDAKGRGLIVGTRLTELAHGGRAAALARLRSLRCRLISDNTLRSRISPKAWPVSCTSSTLASTSVIASSHSVRRSAPSDSWASASPG
jgi:AAA ATPase domain